jgi:hypothetical protein
MMKKKKILIPVHICVGIHQIQASEAQMLERAKAHLYTYSFIGLMEKYEDSMLMLKHTFPTGLARMKSYNTSPHAKSNCKYVHI